MATMKEVALRAGVSTSTVSHVLNESRYVSDDARERVERAIRELAYVPSAVARSLKKNITHTIGMMIPNSCNPYFAEIVRGVEDRCFSAGYTVILCNSDDNLHKQKVYLRVLSERRIDGLIVVSSGDDAELPDLLDGLHIPLVLVDREIDHAQCDYVAVAHEPGGHLACQHLLDLGHSRIACIGGPAELAPSEQRIAGWRLAMREAGLNPPDAALVRGDFTSQGGFEAMKTLLQGEYKPSAVFVCNDLMAIGATCAAYEAGIRVPDELSIVGFDDIELASYAAPPLTTIAQPKMRIGELAVELLLENIQGERAEPRRILLQPELRIRRSTAPHKGG